MDIILYKKSGTARLFQVQAVPITNDEGKMDSLPRAANVGDKAVDDTKIKSPTLKCHPHHCSSRIILFVFNLVQMSTGLNGN